EPAQLLAFVRRQAVLAVAVVASRLRDPLADRLRWRLELLGELLRDCAQLRTRSISRCLSSGGCGFWNIGLVDSSALERGRLSTRPRQLQVPPLSKTATFHVLSLRRGLPPARRVLKPVSWGR